MKKVKFKIQGMTCSSCSSHVEKALNSLEGVLKVEVDLEDKKAVIEMEKEIEDSRILEVIEEAGFVVKQINR